MSAVTDAPQSPQSHTEDAGARAVERAAAGKGLDEKGERAALDYLLGAPEPARYKVVVAYDTPEGLKDLTFHFKAMDGRALDKIEQSHIDERTGVMDKITADMQLVAEAVEAIEDETGAKIAPTDERFRTVKAGEPPLASTIDALQFRFGRQAGLISGVARAIREAAGWNPDRVGKASRMLVAAAGN